MRKMSELLEICKTDHISYGGVYPGMCLAANKRSCAGVITKEEMEAIRDFCSDLVSSISRDQVYLSAALKVEIYPQHSQYSEFIIQTMAQIYDCVVDKLRSENL